MIISNQDVADIVVKLVRDSSGGNYKRMGAVLISSFLARVLCSFSDFEWEEMKKCASHPCGRDGCDCHIWLPDLFNSLDNLREDARSSGVPIPS